MDSHASSGASTSNKFSNPWSGTGYDSSSIFSGPEMGDRSGFIMKDANSFSKYMKFFPKSDTKNAYYRDSPASNFTPIFLSSTQFDSNYTDPDLINWHSTRSSSNRKSADYLKTKGEHKSDGVEVNRRRKEDYSDFLLNGAGSNIYDERKHDSRSKSDHMRISRAERLSRIARNIEQDSFPSATTPPSESDSQSAASGKHRANKFRAYSTKSTLFDDINESTKDLSASCLSDSLDTANALRNLANQLENERMYNNHRVEKLNEEYSVRLVKLDQENSILTSQLQKYQAQIEELQKDADALSLTLYNKTEALNECKKEFQTAIRRSEEKFDFKVASENSNMRQRILQMQCEIQLLKGKIHEKTVFDSSGASDVKGILDDLESEIMHHHSDNQSMNAPKSVLNTLCKNIRNGIDMNDKMRELSGAMRVPRPLNEMFLLLKAYPTAVNHPSILSELEKQLIQESRVVHKMIIVHELDSSEPHGYKKSLWKNIVNEINFSNAAHETPGAFLLDGRFIKALFCVMSYTNLYSFFCASCFYDNIRWSGYVKDALFVRFFDYDVPTSQAEKDKKARHPLIVCLESGNAQYATLMLDEMHSAGNKCIDIKDPLTDRNLWHYAAIHKYEGFIEILKSIGNLPEFLYVKDRDGKTPLELADEGLQEQLYSEIVLYHAEKASEFYKACEYLLAYEKYEESLKLQLFIKESFSHKDPQTLSENLAKLYYNQARALLHLNRWSDCLQCCELCLQQMAKYPSAFDTAAEAHEMLLEWEKGYKVLQKMQELCGKRNETRKMILRHQVEATKFQILEIPNTSSSNEIKQAFNRLCMIWHPDKAADKENSDIKRRHENHFNRLKMAKETLMNLNSRAFEQQKKESLYIPPTVDIPSLALRKQNIKQASSNQTVKNSEIDEPLKKSKDESSPKVDVVNPTHDSSVASEKIYSDKEAQPQHTFDKNKLNSVDQPTDKDKSQNQKAYKDMDIDKLVMEQRRIARSIQSLCNQREEKRQELQEIEQKQMASSDSNQLSVVTKEIQILESKIQEKEGRLIIIQAAYRSKNLDGVTNEYKAEAENKNQAAYDCNDASPASEDKFVDKPGSKSFSTANMQDTEKSTFFETAHTMPASKSEPKNNKMNISNERKMHTEINMQKHKKSQIISDTIEGAHKASGEAKVQNVEKPCVPGSDIKEGPLFDLNNPQIFSDWNFEEAAGKCFGPTESNSSDNSSKHPYGIESDEELSRNVNDISDLNYTLFDADDTEASTSHGLSDNADESSIIDLNAASQKKVPCSDSDHIQTSKVNQIKSSISSSLNGMEQLHMPHDVSQEFHVSKNSARSISAKASSPNDKMKFSYFFNNGQPFSQQAPSNNNTGTQMKKTQSSFSAIYTSIPSTHKRISEETKTNIKASNDKVEESANRSVTESPKVNTNEIKKNSNSDSTINFENSTFKHTSPTKDTHLYSTSSTRYKHSTTANEKSSIHGFSTHSWKSSDNSSHSIHRRSNPTLTKPDSNGGSNTSLRDGNKVTKEKGSATESRNRVRPMDVSTNMRFSTTTDNTLLFGGSHTVSSFNDEIKQFAENLKNISTLSSSKDIGAFPDNSGRSSVIIDAEDQKKPAL